MVGNEPDAIALLKADHRKVEDLSEKFDATHSKATRTSLANEICPELIIHTAIEEELFYPAMTARKGELKAQFEADGLPTPIAWTLKPVEIKLGEPVA